MDAPRYGGTAAAKPKHYELAPALKKYKRHPGGYWLPPTTTLEEFRVLCEQSDGSRMPVPGANARIMFPVPTGTVTASGRRQPPSAPVVGPVCQSKTAPQVCKSKGIPPLRPKALPSPLIEPRAPERMLAENLESLRKLSLGEIRGPLIFSSLSSQQRRYLHIEAG